MDKFELPLEYDRDIAFFDLETTGTNIQVDRIVEICVAKLSADGSLEVRTRRLNPEMPIPPEASKIHGITNDEVAGEPNFGAVASSLMRFIEGCDFAGFNINRFDLPLLAEEFKRAGLRFDYHKSRVIDAQAIFHKKEPRTLAAALEFYCGKSLDDAHSSEADVMATMEVLKGQLKKYEDLPDGIVELDSFCSFRDPSWIDRTGRFRWRGEKAVVGFGRNSGIELEGLAADNPGFLNWIIRGSFPEDTKEIARNALQGIFPEKNSDEQTED